MIKHTRIEVLQTIIEEITHTKLVKWEKELRLLLPTLPKKFSVTIKPERIGETIIKRSEDIWYNAVGGGTLTPISMELTIDDRIRVSNEELQKQLRETYFHEGYHLARGYSFESPNLTLIDVAIEEGLATKFEIEKTKSDPWYGMYKDRKTMLETLHEVIKADQQPGNKEWHKWKFYDPATERYWILYRLGTFLADEVLASNSTLSIEKLAIMPLKKIKELLPIPD